MVRDACDGRVRDTSFSAGPGSTPTHEDSPVSDGVTRAPVSRAVYCVETSTAWRSSLRQWRQFRSVKHRLCSCIPGLSRKLPKRRVLVISSFAFFATSPDHSREAQFGVPARVPKFTVLWLGRDQIWSTWQKIARNLLPFFVALQSPRTYRGP